MYASLFYLIHQFQKRLLMHITYEVDEELLINKYLFCGYVRPYEGKLASPKKWNFESKKFVNGRR